MYVNVVFLFSLCLSDRLRLALGMQRGGQQGGAAALKDAMRSGDERVAALAEDVRRLEAASGGGGAPLLAMSGTFAEPGDPGDQWAAHAPVAPMPMHTAIKKL